MKKIIFSLLIISIILAGLLVFLNTSEAVSLTSPGQLAGQSGKSGISWIIGRFVGGGLAVVGAVTLIMFVYGGFTWIASAGSSDSIQKGKNVMIWATIGLVIILFSYAITEFIIIALTDIPVPPDPPDPPPIINTTPPTDPPPTGCTDMVGGSYVEKDTNGCCSEFPKYFDSVTCTSDYTGTRPNRIYRCCDCGNTYESENFVCRKNPTGCSAYTDFDIVDDTGTVTGTTPVRKCNHTDGKVIRLTGHCGTANYWCTILESQLATSNLQDPSIPPTIDDCDTDLGGFCSSCADVSLGPSCTISDIKTGLTGMGFDAGITCTAKGSNNCPAEKSCCVE